MRCRCEKCSSFSHRKIHVYPICQETRHVINRYDNECNLLKKYSRD